MGHDREAGLSWAQLQARERRAGAPPKRIGQQDDMRRNTIVGPLASDRHFATTCAAGPSQLISLVVNASGRNVHPACSVRCGAQRTLERKMAARHDGKRTFSSHRCPDPHAVGMVVDDDALVRETVAAGARGPVRPRLSGVGWAGRSRDPGAPPRHCGGRHRHRDAASRRDRLRAAGRPLRPDLKVLFLSGLQRPPATRSSWQSRSRSARWSRRSSIC